jgi:predicted RNA-binding Zn-ribbon protein involved in translation (DUF1610 family)
MSEETSSLTSPSTTTCGNPTQSTSTMPTGWVCPKCGKVNAPWVASCDCKAQIVYVSYPVYVPPYTPYYPTYPYTPYYPSPTWIITNNTTGNTKET